MKLIQSMTHSIGAKNTKQTGMILLLLVALAAVTAWNHGSDHNHSVIEIEYHGKMSHLA